MLSALEILLDQDSESGNFDKTLFSVDSCLEAMRIYRNQGIQQASEVCCETLTDGFIISNIQAVLALKEEV